MSRFAVDIKQRFFPCINPLCVTIFSVLFCLQDMDEFVSQSLYTLSESSEIPRWFDDQIQWGVACLLTPWCSRLKPSPVKCQAQHVVQKVSWNKQPRRAPCPLCKPLRQKCLRYSDKSEQLCKYCTCIDNQTIFLGREFSKAFLLQLKRKCDAKLVFLVQLLKEREEAVVQVIGDKVLDKEMRFPVSIQLNFSGLLLIIFLDCNFDLLLFLL